MQNKGPEFVKREKPEKGKSRKKGKQKAALMNGAAAAGQKNQTSVKTFAMIFQPVSSFFREWKST